MNPLDWKGPEFLAAYSVFMISLYVAMEIYRYLLARPTETPQPHELDLDAYEVAVLDSPGTAVKAALVALVHGKTLQFEDGKLSVAGALPKKASHLERKVYELVGKGYESLGMLVEATKAEVGRLEDAMRERGFLLTDAQSDRVSNVPRLLYAGGAMLGLAKVAVGLSRGKPVMLLVLEILFFGLAGLMILSRDRRRTRRGDQALNMLRIRHAALRTTASTGDTGQMLTPGNVVLATGLYGLGALALLDAHPLRGHLMPESASGGGGGGGGSSCSSSSCSSSSSCGGGGGCGGCGGGGD